MTEEDWAFMKRFLLASGSLKALAKEYGISYPTVRLRLDRLIQKVHLLDEAQALGDFERMLRGLYADGKIDVETMRKLREAHGPEGEERSPG
ncbi:DUF2089 family protein [soil metagenome]